MLFRSFFYGRIARHFNSLKWPVLIGSAILVATTGAMALMQAPSVGLVTAVFVVTSTCSAYPTVAHAYARGLVPTRLMGRGVAATNMGIMTAIAAAQFVFGWVLGSFVPVSGVPPEAAYRAAFGVQAAVALIGLTVLAPLRDVRPRG